MKVSDSPSPSHTPENTATSMGFPLYTGMKPVKRSMKTDERTMAAMVFTTSL